MSIAKFNKWQSVDGVTRNAVLQVVAQENRGYANTFSNNTTSTYADMLNMSATITPTSATSKILVTSVGGGLMLGTASSAYFRLLANDEVVWASDRWAYKSDDSTAWSPVNWGSSYLHSPATTNPVTYKFQFAAASGTTPTARIGDSSTGTDSQDTYTAVFLMEIAQ